MADNEGRIIIVDCTLLLVGEGGPGDEVGAGVEAALRKSTVCSEINE